MRTSHRSSRIALLGLLSATAFAGWSLWRAVKLDQVYADSGAGYEIEIPTVAQPEPVAAEQVLAAVDKDPFNPERRRPRQRFRLPSERVTPVRRRPARRVALPPSIKLTGTMVYPGGGGVALLQQRGRSTQMLRVGERLGNLTLRRVGREEAEFRAPDGSKVLVRVSKAGS